MMLRNTQQHWGWLARALHWSMALLILIQIPLGFWMVQEYELYTETYADDTWVMRSSLLHHTLGFILLLLVMVRLGWRQSNTVPDLPPGLLAYQRWLARLTHGLLYLLLIVYPLSGWAALSAYEGEFPIFFFAWDSVPGLVPSVAEGERFDYAWFAEIHRACWRIGAVLLVLHIGAALWHQFYRRDDLLRRMWRG